MVSGLIASREAEGRGLSPNVPEADYLELQVKWDFLFTSNVKLGILAIPSLHLEAFEWNFLEVIMQSLAVMLREIYVYYLYGKGNSNRSGSF